MAIQYSIAVRNAKLDSIETTIGTGPTLEIRSGSPPANCAAADSGTLIVSIVLPSDWMANASNGSKAKNGTWSGTASATGTAGHFRIKVGATCHIQGTVSTSGADLVLDNTSINSGQTVTVNNFAINENNG